MAITKGLINGLFNFYGGGKLTGWAGSKKASIHTKATLQSQTQAHTRRSDFEQTHLEQQT